MKPNFALSLSFEGIRLLHRAAGGWRLVGDVSLESPTMADDLVALRREAEAIAPEGVRSKLLLPNDQIKYLTIETDDIFKEARDTAARAALEGATPYDVADLVYDTSIDGTLTHVAAVAKETLAEVEAFAVENMFYPVAFAAVPGDEAFLGEPFFGPTEASVKILPKGESVEPDGIAVVVVGRVAPPTTDDIPPALPPVIETPAPPPVEEIQVAETPERPVSAPTVQPTPVLSETQEPAIEPDLIRAAQVTSDTLPLDDTPAPKMPAPPVTPKPKKAVKAPKAKEKVEKKTPSVGFASRRTSDAETAAPKYHTPPVTHPKAEPALVAPTQPLAARAPTLPADTPLLETPTSVKPQIDLPSPPSGLENKSFLSKPKAAALSLRRAASRSILTKQAPQTTTPAQGPSEAERLTVFGARNTEIGGKPRFLGLILTTALLVLLAGVAAWAAVFMDDGLSLSRLFGDQTQQTTASVLEEAPQPAEVEVPAVRLAALDPVLSPEDDAVLEALSTPAPQIVTPELNEAELAERYAVSGIWPLAPNVPPDPAGLINIDDLYLTSIDPISTANDAVALPPAQAFDTDVVLAAIGNPAAPGTVFALDSRGLVVPTVQGALSPDGITVFLGRPPVVPPATPTRFQTAPTDTTPRSALAGFRPRAKPDDLAEQRGRAQLGGVTAQERAGFRPALRPQSLQEQAIAALNTDDAVAAALATPEGVAAGASAFSLGESLRPGARPENFGAIVQRAERSRPQQEEVQVASAAGVAPRAVVPNIPSSASVARQATVKNAINLRKVNLIGVYGKPSQRRALVRLSSGRYKKVVVGDRLDGGRVSAMGNSELRYVKSGRNIVLKMPR